MKHHAPPLVAAFALAAAVSTAGEMERPPVRVLVVAETPETTGITYSNAEATYLYLLDYFLSPQRILADDFAVTQVGWQRTAEPFAGLEKVNAVILWDAPRAVEDKRGSDPYYTDRAVVSDATAAKLVEFVRRGGALLVAGGVTCYGNGHARLGSADYRKGNSRTYVGYAGSPLAAVLPVDVPDAVTLLPFLDPKKQRKGVKVLAADPMIDGIAFNKWGFDAYHKVAAKEGAEVLVATADGEPLVARWIVGKGRVVCVTASPRGNGLVHSPNQGSSPLWPAEAVLWDRCLRWTLDLPPGEARREAALVTRYEAVAADAPGVPVELTAAGFPYGTHVVDAALPHVVEGLAMKYFADLGMNHIVSSGFAHIGDGKGTRRTPEEADAYLRGYAEAAARHNLAVFIEPAPADGARLAGLDPKEWAQVTLPSGKFADHYGQPRPCPLSPAVIEHAVKQVEGWAPIAAKYPRIRGAFCDDEWAWVMGYRNIYEGGPGVACYSPWANERFEARTGKKAPPPVYRAPGYVAPEDDPWLTWCQVIRQDCSADYNAALAKAAKAARPDFIMSNYPGGFEGKNDVMVEEVYLDCWKESPLEAFERIDVRANWREDPRRNQIPIYALVATFRMPEDKSVYPETLRLTVGACLGAGAKGVILWNSVNLWSPWFMHPGRESLDAEAKRLGAYLRRFGPMLLELERPESPVWMLSGWFWVNSFDNYYFLFPEGRDPEDIADRERTWWPFQISDVAVPAALRAGIPTEFVTEKQLLSAELLKRKAVVLPGLLYCRQGVVDALEKYIGQGGKVFVDQSARVAIKGATALPVDLSKWHSDIAAGKRPVAQPTEATYRKHRAAREAYVAEAIPVLQKALKDVVRPKVEIDSSAAAWALLENGEGRYLFVYNTDTDKGARLGVSYRELPGTVYDVAAGKEVAVAQAEGTRRFTVELPAGGWKLFALLPARVGHVRVSRARLRDGRLRFRATVFDAQRVALRAAVPLEVTLSGPGGGSFVFHGATSQGVLTAGIPIGASMPVPEAVWVKELLSGRSARAAVGAR